ncbi:MAG: hypothetical protein HYU36_21075 [Planctomycetes bacterium]|nr:hypothetical protein [Planctomycetota bacterium]
MYLTPTANRNEIGDIEAIYHEGRFHVFHLALPSHDAVGHLISEDGLTWQQLPAAVRTGEPDEFDGDQIWTMGVVKFRGMFFMLYTALSERGRMQRVGLATSRDLVRWEKYGGNPVASADPRWYEATPERCRVDFRDPHIVEVDGVLHAFVAARENEGILNRRGCAAHLVSKDGYHWESRPPSCTPRISWDFEVPSVMRVGGRFYMTANLAGIRDVYRVADRVEGPYRRPADDSVLPQTNSSSRPCSARGKTYLFHWLRSQATDWPGPLKTCAALVAPKEVRTSRDGSLWLRSFDGWDAVAREKARPVKPRAWLPGADRRVWKAEGGVVEGVADPGTRFLLLPENLDDCIVEATFELDRSMPPREFGLALRCDETGDQGTFAECAPGIHRVELVKVLHNLERGPNALWRGRHLVQATHLGVKPGRRYRVRAVAYGPYIEVSVNDRVRLSALTMSRRGGRAGIFLEDGAARVHDVTVQPLHAPACYF